MLTEKQKSGRYDRIRQQLKELLSGSPTFISGLSTINAVLYHKIPYIFWIGFYLLDDRKLYVGPYQGPLACQELIYPRGVCWRAINTGSTILVPDVHKFPGHVSCDARSASEIVVPVFSNDGSIIGVLDVDSDRRDAFDLRDKEGLEAIVKLIK